MDEAKLIHKLRLIEALFAGATTEGERVAADRARDRILERLLLFEREDPPVEYRFRMADMWSRKVFVALLRRYGLRPYRYRRQRYTTVMAKVSRRFVEETLWPEFQELDKSLQSYLSGVTDRVVQQVIHQDSSEAEVIEDPKQLPAGGAAGSAASSPGPSTATTSPSTATASSPSTATTSPSTATASPSPATSEAQQSLFEREDPPAGSAGHAGSTGSTGSTSRNRQKRKRKKRKKRRRR